MTTYENKKVKIVTQLYLHPDSTIDFKKIKMIDSIAVIFHKYLLHN